MNRCTARRPVGARPGSSRRPAGVRPGAVRCTVFVLRRPRILYSMPPWGGRTGNFVHQTDPGRQAPDVVHSSRDPWGAPEAAAGYSCGTLDHRKAPVNFFFTRIGRKNRAEPASPHGTPRVQSRAFYGLTVRWKRRENREQPAQHRGAPRRPYGWWKMSRCPWEPRGSRPGTVRNWPKFLFLLALRAPEWICDLGLRSINTQMTCLWSAKALDTLSYTCSFKIAAASVECDLRNPYWSELNRFIGCFFFYYLLFCIQFLKS